MPFYEIIFENGNYAVANYENDEEANRAISAHHNRAKSGLPAQESNPQMGPAERVFKVLKYDEHPANYRESGTVEASDLQLAIDEAINDKAVGTLVSVPEIASEIRYLTDPVKAESDPHESNYKMDETGELTGWDN